MVQRKMMRKYMVVRALVILITTVLISSFLSGITSRVVLTDGGNEKIREVLEDRLTSIVNTLDKKRWDVIKDYCTNAGFISLIDLVEKTECKNINPLYETKLLDLPNGGFEVRDIKVKVNMQKIRGNPFQYMVFTITEKGLLDDVRFAIEQFHYKEIIKEGERLQDFVYRQQILQFIEIFRTSYNRKDLEYLKKVYSDDALIIVGRVLQRKPGEPDYLERSHLAQDQIQFIKLSKLEYIDRLDRIFKNVAFLKVNFEEVTITRHPKINEIYGVTLKQYWKTPNYYDEGYLFLMIDFRDMNNPLIHVRSWQPEKFVDGSVVSLGDFELIE